MPIYEYHCRACGHDFETLVRGAEAPACAHCASGELEKKLSVFASPASDAASLPAAGPCGTCSHPAGPGACALN